MPDLTPVPEKLMTSVGIHKSFKALQKGVHPILAEAGEPTEPICSI